MTIKEMIEIFELQIAAGNWDEDDEVFVRDDTGVFDTIDFFLLFFVPHIYLSLF